MLREERGKEGGGREVRERTTEIERCVWPISKPFIHCQQRLGGEGKALEKKGC